MNVVDGIKWQKALLGTLNSGLSSEVCIDVRMHHTKEGEPLDQFSLIKKALESQSKVAQMDQQGQVVTVVENDVDRLLDYEKGNEKPNPVKSKQGGSGTRPRAVNKGKWLSYQSTPCC